MNPATISQNDVLPQPCFTLLKHGYFHWLLAKLTQGFMGLALLLLLTRCVREPNEQVNALAEPLLVLHLGNDLGITFKNTVPESAQMNSLTYEYYYNGGGVSIGDINKDGLPDLFFTGNVSNNKLFLNLGGLKFRDVTKEVGVRDSPSWTTGSTMVDINNDGILDIYVCRSGKLPESKRANLFFVSQGLKNGLPNYTEMAAELGLNDTGYGTQAIFFDFDRDNDLDMFLLNHNVYVQPYYSIDEIRNTVDPNVGDKLFRNDGGKFTDMSRDAGMIANELGYGLGVAAGDLNNDGWPDLYIANDYSEHDFLYINQHDGSFKEVAKSAFNHQSSFSMGTDIADFNNDGFLDISVLDMVAEDNYGIKTSMSGMDPEQFNRQVSNGFHYQYMQNTLQLNRGNLAFSEIAQLAGVSNTDWSWAPLFLDIDLDGLQDLFITNGLKRDFRNNDYRNYKIKTLEKAEQDPNVEKNRLIQNLVAMTPKKKLNNYVYKNLDGYKFQKRVEAWGIDVASFSNGLAYADLDQDGDLDLVTNNVDEFPFVYENKARDFKLGDYLKIKLEGPNHNLMGMGSRIELYTQGIRQIREVYATRGYQSSVAPIAHFGIKSSLTPDSLMIRWPDGKQQRVLAIDPNSTVTLRYVEAKTLEQSQIPQSTRRYFSEDVAHDYGLTFKHEENTFDDFTREILLPHKMSRLGPTVEVGDINGDGWDDVFLGGASGQVGTVFFQNEHAFFEKSQQPDLEKDRQFEDMGALLFDIDKDGDLDLYVVSGGNEFDRGSPNLVDRLYKNEGGVFVRDQWSDFPESGFAVEGSDFDQDGDMDLLVTGRQFPGHYPLAVSSKLLVNNDGVLSDQSKVLAPDLEDIGMITSVSWSDYDLDGDDDLILAGEWTPLIFLENKEGKFLRDTEISGIGSTEGWWQCITALDVEGDGDMDYILGNNGLNYKYKASAEAPFEIYADDFDGNGNMDIVLGYYNDGDLFPLRGRQCSAQQIPNLAKKFQTYHEFAKANLVTVYGQENLQDATHLTASTFGSILLRNLGNKQFKQELLPTEAQFSSVNSILARDIDGDQNMDLLLAGNNYQSEVETPRNDASYGTLFKGKSDGTFQSLPNSELGLYLRGDVRDLDWIQLRSGAEGVLVAINNDRLRFHVFHTKPKNQPN